MRAKLIGLVISCLVLAIVATGCWSLDFYTFVKPEGSPYYKQVAKAYHLTELRKSSAADVLPMIHMPEYSLLSQSTKVLAAHGTKKKGFKNWFTMVSFDEDDLLAKRKYLLIVDEKPKVWFNEPWAGLSFDCQMLLEGDELAEPFTDENLRRIAVLQFVKNNVNEDIGEVKTDNKAYEIAGAMINQALNAVLHDLDEAPALAAKLTDAKGLSFEHVTFDRGKIQMTDDERTATVKIRLGSFTRGFQKVKDPNYAPEP